MNNYIDMPAVESRRMLKKTTFSPAQPWRAKTRLVPSKAAGESKPEAYPQGYVEDFDESRTKLAAFFSSLIRVLRLGR